MPGWRRGSRCCGHASYGIRCETGYGFATTCSAARESIRIACSSHQKRGPHCKMRRGRDVWARDSCSASPPARGRRGHWTCGLSDKGKPAGTAGGSGCRAQQPRGDTGQHNTIVASAAPAEAMRILDDANNNGQADPGEHLRVVPLGEHIVYGQGGAPPLGTWAGPISFTKTFGTLPAVTFHRDGSASEAGPPYPPPAAPPPRAGPRRGPRPAPNRRGTA